MSTVNTNLLRLALRVNPTTKSGKRFRGTTDDGITIATSTGASPIHIVTTVAHGLSTGDLVTIYGHATNTGANNTASNPYWVVTWVSATEIILVGSVYVSGSGTGGTLTPFMVGSVDGARFSRQRLLNIYNDARMVLFNAVYTDRKEELSRLVYSTAITANITWTYSSPNTTAPKPTGYLKLISLMSPTAGVPVIVLDNSLLQTVQLALNPHLTQSSTNIIGFEIGTNFLVPAYDCHGTGTITYYGITAWSWSTDVLPNSSLEIFSSDLEPVLIELGEAIANEQSNADIGALAKTLLNKKGS
jgi:hypothetical protein